MSRLRTSCLTWWAMHATLGTCWVPGPAPPWVGYSSPQTPPSCATARNSFFAQLCTPLPPITAALALCPVASGSTTQHTWPATLPRVPYGAVLLPCSKTCRDSHFLQLKCKRLALAFEALHELLLSTFVCPVVLDFNQPDRSSSFQRSSGKGDLLSAKSPSAQPILKALKTPPALLA